MPKKTATDNLQTVKVGKNIELPINPVDSQFVPAEAQEFIGNEDLITTLAYGIQSNLPVLLVGDTGTGKTSAVRHLAHITNNSFRRLNLNGQTTADEFVGKILVNDTGTYWVDGILIEAMRHGYWLLLDELNAALPEVLFVLQSLLDDDRFIVLSDKEDKEIVRPHENFRLFATMNPSDGYVGTKDLNKALMSRFPLVVEVDYPDADIERAIIESHVPEMVGNNDIDRVVDLAQQARKSYRDGEMDFVFSTRDLINWARTYVFYKDWYKAAVASILAKSQNEDRASLSSLIKLNLVTTSNSIMEMSEGDEVRLTDNVPVHNRPSAFPKDSRVKVVEKKVGTRHGDVVMLELIKYGRGFNPDNFAVDTGFEPVAPGMAFSARVENIDGKFASTIKTK